MSLDLLLKISKSYIKVLDEMHSHQGFNWETCSHAPSGRWQNSLAPSFEICGGLFQQVQ